ncbi:MAG TPA: DUF58 domain-containing protein [Gemmatimonadales bacterium]
MILPTRSWFLVAAGLALLAPIATLRPEAALLLVGADLLWIAGFLADAWRAAGAPLGDLTPSRDAPPAFSVGRPLPVVYRWRNPWNRPLVIRVREEVSASLRPPGGGGGGGEERQVLLAAGGSAREELVFVPVRRGKETAGTMHVRVRGPWGLAWRQGRIALPWPVTVYPRLDRALPSLLPPARRRREAGLRSVRRPGEGRLFESLREWVPDDDSRTIDWKATARRGKVMVRQYEDERRQQVLLVLDAGRMLTAVSDDRPRLEAAIDAALSLAASAADHDDDIGLLVFTDRVERYLRPARGRRALRAIMDALAAVEGRLVEPDYPAAFAYLAARSRKRAFTVVFTDVIDRTASEALLAQAGALRPRHLPLAVTIRDPALERLVLDRPADVEAAFWRAAAEELLLARAEALAEMRRQGVLVLDVAPGSAAREVVAQYERLKRTGRI